jgi:hypothetical protein
MKHKAQLKKETNSTVYDRLKRLELSCPLCPPNKGENRKHRPKYGRKKSKLRQS